MDIALIAAVAATRRRRRANRVIVSDSFNRANSALSLGVADTGQAWQAIAGTLGVNGNAAYNASGTNDAIAVVDAGVANCDMQVTLAALGGDLGLYARVTDAGNWIRLVRGAGSPTAPLILQKRVAGVTTSVRVVSGVPVAAGDILRLSLRGTVATMYINGAPIDTPQTVAEFTSVTRHGIGCGAQSAAARWDNFRVTA